MIRMVNYDITDDKARTRLADLLLRHGFERIQYSAFIGVIAANRWKKLWKRLQKFHEKHCATSDSIISHVIERDHFEKIAILGHDLDQEWILQETRVWFV